MCGWGIEAKPAGETSRFLIQLVRMTVLGVTTLKPTAHSSAISGKASDGRSVPRPPPQPRGDTLRVTLW